MRIFLDANVLFSAARSDGAVRQLLKLLVEDGHALVADAYVAAEAARNTSAKCQPATLHDLRLLSSVVEVAAIRPLAHVDASVLAWLPDKDRPVLEAAIVLRCDVLVTGDKKHFGAYYGQSVGGVRLLSPAMLAEWPPAST